MAVNDIGTGASIAFTTSTWTINATSISWSGISRAAVANSHLGTSTWQTFLKGDLTDPGSITVEGWFDGDIPPPWTGAAETITVTIPIPTAGGSAGATFAATGFLTDFEFTLPLEDMQTASATFKMSSTLSQTDHT